jgi:hypothetical protein
VHAHRRCTRDPSNLFREVCGPESGHDLTIEMYSARLWVDVFAIDQQDLEPCNPK